MTCLSPFGKRCLTGSHSSCSTDICLLCTLFAECACRTFVRVSNDIVVAVGGVGSGERGVEVQQVFDVRAYALYISGFAW